MGALQAAVSALKAAFSDQTIKVNRQMNPLTGFVTYEEWLKDGKLHRDDGPATIERDAKTGVVTCEYWIKDGKQDRTGGPAVIIRDRQTGKVTDEAWFKDGRRIDPVAPATAAPLLQL
jgi:hypothetical protein